MYFISNVYFSKKRKTLLYEIPISFQIYFQYHITCSLWNRNLGRIQSKLEKNSNQMNSSILCIIENIEQRKKNNIISNVDFTIIWCRLLKSDFLTFYSSLMDNQELYYVTVDLFITMGLTFIKNCVQLLFMCPSYLCTNSNLKQYSFSFYIGSNCVL